MPSPSLLEALQLRVRVRRGPRGPRGPRLRRGDARGCHAPLRRRRARRRQKPHGPAGRPKAFLLSALRLAWPGETLKGLKGRSSSWPAAGDTSRPRRAPSGSRSRGRATPPRVMAFVASFRVAPGTPTMSSRVPSLRNCSYILLKFPETPFTSAPAPLLFRRGL